MANVKFSVEADSVKEIFEDFIASMEEMGACVIKANEEIPENLEGILASKGIAMFREGDSISEELIQALLKEDQEEVLELILQSKDARYRLIEKLKEEGVTITPDKE